MKKKISQIIAYSVLGLFVTALILCAIIKLDFKPDMKVPNIANVGQIQILANDGTNKVESDAKNIKPEEFSKVFNDSFKLTVLYSLFSGKIGSEMDVTKTTKEPTISGYKVQFIYVESQTLRNDGKDITVATNSKKPITYDRFLVGVEPGKGLTETNLYFYINGQDNYYKVTTIANFDNLYNYISEIPMFGE